MYRPIESPCFLERGIPIGMLFVVQDAVHQALMLQAVTINNEPLGTNVSVDENFSDTTASLPAPATAGTPTAGAIVAGGANTMLEQTLDTTPVLVSQTVNTSRQIFKGGILKLAIKLKGWEMPGGWKAFCQSNMPQIMPSNSAG
jgi:hypothetical protein